MIGSRTTSKMIRNGVRRPDRGSSLYPSVFSLAWTSASVRPRIEATDDGSFDTSTLAEQSGPGPNVPQEQLQALFMGLHEGDSHPDRSHGQCLHADSACAQVSGMRSHGLDLPDVRSPTTSPVGAHAGRRAAGGGRADSHSGS